MSSEMIGALARISIGAIAFGIWQGSLAAGFFMYFALATLERRS